MQRFLDGAVSEESFLYKYDFIQKELSENNHIYILEGEGSEASIYTFINQTIPQSRIFLIKIFATCRNFAANEVK